MQLPYFGRERLIRELIGIMGDTIESGDRLLAVVGPSGSGKSSVVMAGLLPTLKKGELKDSEDWVYLTPFTPGGDPLEELSHVLKIANPPNYRGIRKELESTDCLGLVRIANDLIKSDDQRVFVYIDQFEELFTLVDEEREREHFINTIVAAATEPGSPVVVVLTLRADFYDRPMNYNLLGELIQSNNRSVLPLTLGELNDAITLPAQLDDVQLEFEDELVAEIAFDLLEFRDPADKTTSLAGALPLLQFALQRLYNLRQGNLLTMPAYKEMGRVSGAIGSHAEDEFKKLSEIEDNVLHRVFYHLVNIDEFGAPTRRRTKRPDVTQGNPAAERLVESLVSNRLLVAGKDEMLEVAHEALLRSWGRLRDWIETNGRHIQWLQKVQADAQEWEHQDKPNRLLWDYEELQPVYEAIDQLKITLDPVTREFVRPQTDRLLDDFETTPEYRQLGIIDRWLEIGADAAPALVGALAYAKGDVVLDSIDQALWQIPHAAEAALIAALDSEDANAREAVADAVGRLEVVNAVRGLLDNIMAESKAYCLAEINAINALRTAARVNRDTIPALLDVLKDSDKRSLDERRAAAEALGTVIEANDRKAVQAFVESLNGDEADKNWEVREAIVLSLGKIGATQKPHVDVLINKTRERGESYHVHRAAIESLGELRQRRAMTQLVNGAVDNREDIRFSAVKALAILETEDVLSMLMYRLKDEPPKVRQATAEALGTFGHAHAWRPLVDALETERVPQVRVAIVRALECYPDKYDVARALRRSLQDDTASVRAAAAHALGTMDKDHRGRNIQALLDGFKDRDTDVKITVIKALGALQTNQATQTLFNTLRGNRTWRIRFQGAVALAAIRDDSIEEDLRSVLDGKDSDAAFASAVVLAGLGDDSARVKKELLGALSDPRVEARCIAAGALGKLRNRAEIS